MAGAAMMATPATQARQDVSITLAVDAASIAAVKSLFLDYLRFVEGFLGESLSFQNTEAEFRDFPAGYDGLFLARVNDRPAGAVGFKPFSPRAAELKRLWVAPAARGRGLGEALIRAAIRAARADGYCCMLLDTDPGLAHANRIYERMGFRDVESYYPNPRGGRSRYMRLDFGPPSPLAS